MKYNLSIDIAGARDDVAALFADPENLHLWQDGLLRYEALEGERGAEGSKSRLLYKVGKKQYEMTETVVTARAPEEFRMIYEARGVWNEVINRFSEAGPDQTHWTVDTEYRCRGLMWLMSLLMPGMFKNQAENYMRQFKAFVESDRDDAAELKAGEVADPAGG